MSWVLGAKRNVNETKQKGIWILCNKIIGMWCYNTLKGNVIILTMIRKISKSTLMSSLRNNWTMTVICGALDDWSTRFSLVSSSSTLSSLWRWTDRTSAKLYLWKHERWLMRQSDTSSEHSHQLMWEFQVFSCSFVTLDGANKHTPCGPFTHWAAGVEKAVDDITDASWCIICQTNCWLCS